MKHTHTQNEINETPTLKNIFLSKLKHDVQAKVD